jgi:hypothetical protein
VGNNSLSDKSLNKFAVCTPAVAAMFPAMALQYRRGDITESKPVVVNRYALSDLYALKGGAAAAQALDELRRSDQPSDKAENGNPGIDPMLFYAGGVYQAFSDSRRAGQNMSGSYIGHSDKRVRSSSGEVDLDYGSGVLKVDTPRSKSVTGFCRKAGECVMGSVKIKCDNEYGSISVISLDAKPLENSGKILIQAMTYDQPLGFRTVNGKISSLGKAPFGIEQIDAQISVRLNGAEKAKVSALDENGYRTDKAVTFSHSGEILNIKLCSDAVYHVIER